MYTTKRPAARKRAGRGISDSITKKKRKSGADDAAAEVSLPEEHVSPRSGLLGMGVSATNPCTWLDDVLDGAVHVSKRLNTPGRYKVEAAWRVSFLTHQLTHVLSLSLKLSPTERTPLTSSSHTLVG